MNKLKWFVIVLCLFFLTAAAGSLWAAESIVLKVIVANPSKDKTQKVPVKVYLPKEAKSEDVIDKEDLEIGYDTQQGSYYVYGNYEIKPLETLEKTIEIRDIWIIPQNELSSLREDADKTKDLLKGTEFADRITFLYNSILAKLDEIEEWQKVLSPNPEDHISEYRYNLKLLDSAKTDIALARSMLDKAKNMPSSMSWKLIFFILIFLGSLALSFYWFWYRQAKFWVQEQFPKEEGKKEGGENYQEHKSKEDKKDTKGEDIEKIIRGE